MQIYTKFCLGTYTEALTTWELNVHDIMVIYNTK